MNLIEVKWLKRFAVGFSYIGAAYCGYQAQGNGDSVAEVLAAAIEKVANHNVKLGCAGRTDKGVHAVLQVVHFDSDANRSEYQWLRGVNANLPEDISVLWVKEVPDDFHARFSARFRSYVYVLNPGANDLFMDRYSWKVGALDIDLMQTAGAMLLGEHDFHAFQSRHCQAEHAIRRVHAVSVFRVGEMVHFEIQANAFVHHMVRKITATLVAIGEGKIQPDVMLSLLQEKNRQRVPGQAPSKGLFLKSVGYADHYGLSLKHESHLTGGRDV